MEHLVHERMRAAILRAFPEVEARFGPAAADPLLAPCKSVEHGDMQCNAAMGLAKRLGSKPRDVAQAIVAAADLAGVALPLTAESIAGPGFINIRLDPAAIARGLEGMARDEGGRLGVSPASPRETVVVDLMGVNLAKQMHVGHLRSPIVGDALARLFERLGHGVIRQNHVGDWGLPIAMVIARLARLEKAGAVNLERLTLDQLDTAYRAAQAECQRDAAGLEAARRFGLGPKALAELEEQVAGATEAFMEARQTLIRLQAKDPATHAIWRRIYDVTMRVCLDVCRDLDVRVSDADTAGESSYADELADMVADLTSRGVAEPDAGALIVRLDTPPSEPSASWEAIKEPCLVRKSDGGFLYATTDIAAVRRRVQRMGADRVVYAIDARQSLHMKQVFASAIKAGYATNARTGRPAHLEHAAFGSILGEDGKPFKTRSGENVKLADLIAEMFGRAREAVASRGSGLSGDEADRVARGVGIAALKYADLSVHRTNDVVFSFDRMLAFEGNTGPYLLYAVVRIRSIFRKAVERGVGEAWRTTPLVVADPAERALALALLRYAPAVRSAADALEPHRLCQYLYDLAGAFAVFFDRCPVLGAEDAGVRDGRLRLCELTGRVLADGLETLGIPTVDRM